MKKTIVLFFVLITSACARVPERGSILNESNCQLPCWNDIVPGQTTKDQLIKIVANLTAVNQKTVTSNKISSSQVYEDMVFFDMYPQSKFSQVADIKVQVSISHDIVRNFNFCGDLKTTIGEITKIIGDPEYIISNGNYAGGRDVILINPQDGIRYWYLTNLLPENKQKEISPSIEVHCISMFDTNLYDQMLEEGEFSMGFYNKAETMKVMYQWSGYGDLDKKYHPRQP